MIDHGSLQSIQEGGRHGREESEAPRADDLEQTLAAIEKGQQLAGHYPSAADMDRARRVLSGELTAEDARAEMNAALSPLVEEERSATHGRR